MKSLFVTFEGGEGAGKTTLIDRIERHLKEQNLEVVRTREPGGSLLSETIRKWVLEHNDLNIAPMTELLLFLAARAQHIAELILPSLQQGKIVLCDRFNDSTVAYQGVARGLGFERVAALCDLVSVDCVPDLTLYLDLDPQIGLQRSRLTEKDTAASGELDKIESQELEFHEDVRTGFLLAMEKAPNRIRIIDAARSRDEVFEQALTWIERALASRNV